MGGIKKQVIPEEISTYIESLENSNKSLENRVKILEEELRLERVKRFGKSSEKVTPLQSELFDEFEQTALDIEEEDEPEVISIPAYNRKKKGRKPIDPSLPRKQIIHDISEDDKQCACGCQMVKIDEVVTERVQIIPEKSYVEQHIRPKYACRNCEGSGDEDKPTFRVAPAPPSLISGSIVTGGLLAYIHTNKFCDYLPFYRQEKRFERYGIPISRQNMSNWTIKAYRKLKGLNDIMKDHIKTGTYLQMDETVLKVHGEVGKLDSSNSYIWVTCGGPKDSSIALYEYNRSRSSKYIKDFTEGFSGFCQSDGFPGYNAVFKNSDKITHVTCLAHCRRELYDAYKASKQLNKSNVVINKIQKIYVVEKQLRDKNLKPEEFVAERKKLATPLLDNLKDWLDKKAINIRPESKLGKAVKYTLGQWDKMINYLDCAELTPDNNAAERVVKPLVMGRKNFLFSGSPEGADALCFFYSLIETAKLNDLNPYAYLKWLYDKAPLLPEGSSLEELAPWKCDPIEVNKIMLPS
ncbi:IS66 family transposase [Thiospirochaeta perfilievii]|uniref:IS66 family transposase n=1 Tax=Thiospirochaeta perfilievii TaxID=252967 RepID=A0A5C1QFW7_9SPIO|nr:IS66 family transposase [Thiospirochaeta perfilievii]QEN03565.1 IS66 family transposase [Thiospirochaeta perfilievii]QEN04139.1 IS66 family transposase [Thiospirochaeta perfilievii]QEN04151.1 IS66 family transposase [Thiospirochaeta perfilievii]QEN04564.1 IS66 family transposase [Thiospirochaeta perfilievii]QEN04760.1 IS66 family transposase [Thiospirochaeta perfilievii]